MARTETKMTLAFSKAANTSLDSKTGYVGQRVLTNQLMGIGKMKPRETIKLKKRAETAVAINSAKTFVNLLEEQRKGNVGVLA